MLGPLLELPERSRGQLAADTYASGRGASVILRSMSAVSHAHYIVPQQSFVAFGLTEQHLQDIARMEEP